MPGSSCAIRCTAQWQQLDLLVNNAGVAGSGEVSKYRLEDWQWILGINLNAGIYGCHFFIPVAEEESARCATSSTPRRWPQWSTSPAWPAIT